MIIRDVREMQRTCERIRLNGKRIAVVPTRGALHEGHLSLIRIAKLKADAVVTTVFVNPMQFPTNEDAARYPRTFEKDLQLSSTAGTEYLFVPDTAQLYPTGYATQVSVDGITAKLEGDSRPAYFRGVATIATKLLNITKPHVAVFGQKDAQQIAVIRRMVKDLNIDVEILVGPTIREPDGLALSALNIQLTPQQRKEAVVLFRALKLAEQRIKEGERECLTIANGMRELIESQSSGVVDYISIADNFDLHELEHLQRGKSALASLAVVFGTTRLTDNLVILV